MFRSEQSRFQNCAPVARHQLSSSRGVRIMQPASRNVKRGRQRNNVNSGTLQLHGLDLIRELLKEEPEVIIVKMSSPQFQLKQLFQGSEGEMTELLLRLINKACMAIGNTCNLNYIIQQVNSSGFFIGPVTTYITKSMMNLSLDTDHTVFLTICDVLKACQDRIPAASSENVTAILAQLKSVEAAIKKFGLKSELRRNLQELEEKHSGILRQIQGGRLKKFQKPDQNYDNAAEPPNNFRQIPIEPTPADLLDDIDPFLRKNRITEVYRDAEQYLDIQFRLLREDYIYPLRQGIRELRRAGQEQTDERYIQDVQIYNTVRFMGSWYNDKGIIHRIQFDTMKLKHVKWEHSQRLKYGSLLCLSSDGFTTFVIGIVQHRKPELLKEGLIDITLYNLQQQTQFNRFTVYKMVECSAYFEAYRYNLESLQEVNDTKLPFLDYLLGQRHSTASPPRYLRETNAEYDFAPLLDRSPSSKKWSVLDTAKWMKAKDFGLDQSQYNALRMALTHEFSLIQGPPGTGKTFIALKIVQLLLHNFNVWGRRRQVIERGIRNCPILLVCYTNHALDQFLEGILEFTRETGSVIRVGGRCNSDNENVLQCQLAKLKHDPTVRCKIPEDVKDAKLGIIEQMSALEKYLSEIVIEQNKSLRNILEDRCLLPMMTNYHRMCFEVMMQGQNRSVIRTWLFCDANWKNETKNELWDEGMDGDVSSPILDKEDNNGDRELEEMIEEEMQKADEECMVNVEDDENAKRLGDLSKLALDRSLQFSDEPAQKNMPEQWQSVTRRKRYRRILRTELNKLEFMPEEEESTISDLQQLPIQKRWSLYRLWRSRFCADCSYRMQESTKYYNELAQRLEELRQEEDYIMLKSGKVIAMTTTGAAKYRRILNRIKPSIVIVEEAAEVLEAHIITSLSESCEHLILIGDHQQLRPKPTVYKLAKQYNLEVSLFERMLMNNLICAQLETQHRMRPEIAELIVPHIYPHLLNDKSVEEYDNVRGVGGNLFFIHHHHAELQTADTKSRKNIHEAEYLTAFCRYIILQGYQPSEVTILTTYTGQMFEIKKRIRRDEVTSSVRVTPVDNFQGEENNIILLSLVRSNEQGKVGFLKIENRICVALSRAKKGLFVIGDMELMEESSPVWKNICCDLRAKGKIVDGLPLFCQNHPGSSVWAINVKDFSKAPDGGCTRPCEYRLKCGHVCERLCHPADPEHKEYKCQKPCLKTNCKLKHKCPKKCFEDCGKCMVLVEKTIPRCQHKLDIPCYLNPSEYKCTMPCEKTMRCGHICPRLCGDECAMDTECQVIVPGRKWPCGHQLDVVCCRNEDNYPCPVYVERSLPCGHRAKVKCSEDVKKVNCMEEMTLVFCERKCQNKFHCYLKDKYLQQGCQVMVKRVCERNTEHVFNVKCNEYEKSTCNFPCNTKLKCGHTCMGKCGTCLEIGLHEPCMARCTRMLPCQHKCQGVCGEPCPPCQETCMRSCPHGICRNKCGRPCSCKEQCVRRCQHSKCTHSCSEICDQAPCCEPCPLILSCGHYCPCYCGEPCATICPVCCQKYYIELHKRFEIPMNRKSQYVVILPCRHVIPVECMDKEEKKYLNHLDHAPREFKLFRCPLCMNRITHCPKYQRLVVNSEKELQMIKEAIIDSSNNWQLLQNSTIGKQLHKEIQQLSGEHQLNLNYTLKKCLGCVGMLDEVRVYLMKMQHSKKLSAMQQEAKDLKKNLEIITTELGKHIVNHAERRTEIDDLSLKIQLLFMQGILLHMLTYIRNPRKKNDITCLLHELTNLKKKPVQKAMVRSVIRQTNHNLCQIIPKTLRNGIDNYEAEIKKYFKHSVELLVEKKWLICSNGHAYCIPVSTEVQTSYDHCSLCHNNAGDDDDDDDDDDDVLSSDNDSSEDDDYHPRYLLPDRFRPARFHRL